MARITIMENPMKEAAYIFGIYLLVLLSILTLQGCGSNGGGGAECGPVFQQVDVPTVDLSQFEASLPEEAQVEGEKLSQDGQTTTVIGCSIVGDTVTDDDVNTASSDDHSVNGDSNQ